MTNFTSSSGPMWSRFSMRKVPSWPLEGHLTSTTFTTLSSTPDSSTLPLVSRRTLQPPASRRSMRGEVSSCRSGSPPVTSTSQVLNAATSEATSSTVISLAPSALLA